MEAFIKNDNTIKRFIRPLKKRLYLMFGWRDKIFYYLFSIPKKGNMPDVIVAGLPKTSTTWIAKTLKLHQDVVLVSKFRPNRGEINYFTGFLFNLPIKKYFDFYANKDSAKLYVEKSPTYASIPLKRIKLIKKLNPDVKIILGFRDPVDWMISFAKMEMVTGMRQLEPNDNNWEEFLNYYQWKKVLIILKKFIINGSVFLKRIYLYLTIMM